ncbi:hypothetical protein [Aerosakkonema funiforme]|uniref:Uncharacterized protein n=1 Tax=Aerosakkonema funiforme FACHB-1375 TaxID=2949571 RepID=A0A926VF04_9CYAN|nr:hypothetical protein [Aerosakkonema funiforme]MBD2182695.1 hypothetical protein [Aerosakkonema funiforme FACHB-1375]
MADIRKILNQISAQEMQLRDRQFLAPCVRGGAVKTRVAHIIYNFAPKPHNFEGWGIFQPVDEKIAEVIDEPNLPQMAEYLKLLQPMRLRLAYVLRGKTWLAYPVNESDAKQRFGIAKPVAVHLVNDGATFEQIIARWDGGSWWFDECDRRADPLVPEQLKEALKKVISPAELRFKGVTPEMRTIYDLVAQQAKEFAAQMQQKRDEKRLISALRQGGGELREFRDRNDHWLVEWTTADGEFHSSAISKNDLTVVSSGICLSGRDRDFDLQSLVGVMEGNRD